MTQRILIILHPGFEEMEAVTSIDLLARAGLEVIQASTSDDHLVEGRNGITLRTGRLLSDLADATFDAILLPGGPGIQKLRGDARITGSLRRHHDAGKLIGAICAAPLLLLDAGLIPGHAYTAHPSTSEELEDAREAPVVVDGTIITSKGAGTATEFSLALVHALCGKETASEIAASICWSHPI